MIKIIGAKGNISDVDNFLKKVINFSKENNLIIQVFNADLIYGKNHILSAFNHADRAMKTKTNTTNSLEMEILLYASGKRQLKHAIPKMGVKSGNTKIVVAIIGSKISNESIDKMLNILSLVRNDKVIQGNIDTLKKFDIGQNEIKTVAENKYEDLILEKIALVDTVK